MSPLCFLVTDVSGQRRGGVDSRGSDGDGDDDDVFATAVGALCRFNNSATAITPSTPESPSKDSLASESLL
jgi:hypothetical protein